MPRTSRSKVIATITEAQQVAKDPGGRWDHENLRKHVISSCIWWDHRTLKSLKSRSHRDALKMECADDNKKDNALKMCTRGGRGPSPLPMQPGGRPLHRPAEGSASTAYRRQWGTGAQDLVNRDNLGMRTGTDWKQEEWEVDIQGREIRTAQPSPTPPEKILPWVKRPV